MPVYLQQFKENEVSMTRYIVKERLVVNRRRELVTKGYYVYDAKKAEAVSPVYHTLKHANGHRDRLEEGSK